ncbi:HugZ family pyridoxamine 5'-phosphate oxidase [Glaciimonas sp. GG7]
MKINFPSAIHLLHETTWGNLATHSTQLPGYPFATILPFAVDEQHCPIFLISALAEHTKNLMADCRSSVLIHRQDHQNMLTTERMSIVGDAIAITPSPELIARYVRYHPDARDYLALGDFSFYRLQPQRARYVAGFGLMGWVEKDQWERAEVLSLIDERNLLQEIADTFSGSFRGRVLGIDSYGFDVEKNGQRSRERFPETGVTVDQIGDVVRRFLATME